MPSEHRHHIGADALRAPGEYEKAYIETWIVQSVEVVIQASRLHTQKIWAYCQKNLGTVDWRLKIEDSPGLFVQIFNPNALQSLGVKMNVHVLTDGMFMDR